jgi:predicted MFS family arabinose efflux permease
LTEDDSLTLRPGERRQLAALGFLQFTNLLDLVLLPPLAPSVMQEFGLDSGGFSLVMTSFSLASLVVGLGFGLQIDRFERRRLLLGVAGGLALGNLLCALSTSFAALLGARVVAGACAGVLSAMCQVYLTDAIPPRRRGAALAIMSSSYAFAFVLGAPLGLVIAGHFSWHMAYFFAALLGALAVTLGALVLPPRRDHLAAGSPVASVSQGLADMATVLRDPPQRRSLWLLACLQMSAFMVIPFLATYLVRNLRFAAGDLPWFYFLGGLTTLAAGTVAGKLSDRFGAARVCAGAALLSIPVTLLNVHLPRLSFAPTAALVAAFMALVAARRSPAILLGARLTSPGTLAEFTALGAASQQLAVALGVALAGRMLRAAPGEPLAHFGWVGLVSGLVACLGAGLAFSLRSGPEIAFPGPEPTGPPPRLFPHGFRQMTAIVVRQ